MRSDIGSEITNFSRGVVTARFSQPTSEICLRPLPGQSLAEHAR